MHICVLHHRSRWRTSGSLSHFNGDPIQVMTYCLDKSIISCILSHGMKALKVMVWILLQWNMFHVTADIRDIQGEKLREQIYSTGICLLYMPALTLTSIISNLSKLFFCFCGGPQTAAMTITRNHRSLPFRLHHSDLLLKHYFRLKHHRLQRKLHCRSL